MSDPKRHHYLPESYLNRFCRDGRLWLYDRIKRQFRRQKPSQVAVIGHYYTVRDSTGEKSLAVEHALQRLEAEASPIIDLVDRRENPNGNGKMRLAEFVATLFTRVPQFEEDFDAVSEDFYRWFIGISFGSPEAAKAAVESYRHDTGEGEDIDPNKIHQFVAKGEYGIEFGRENSISAMLTLAPKFATYFSQMNWTFFHAPEPSSFVTTDTPFVLQSPAGHKRGLGFGILTPGASKVVALSQKTCLVMGDRGKNMIHLEISRNDVRHFNLTLAAHAHKLVVGRDEALVRSIVERTGIDGTQPQARFVVGLPSDGA